MFNRQQFRILLLIYFAFWTAISIFGAYFGLSNFRPPDELMEKLEPSEFSILLGLSMGVVSLILTSLTIVSWIGLFVFWKFARILFVLSEILTYLGAPILSYLYLSKFDLGVINSIKESYNPNPLMTLPGYVLAFLSGVIIACMFTKAASHLFENSHAGNSGDSTGGLIPYKNPKALIAYYLGVFSVIPGIGILTGVAAVVLGILGLREKRRNPIIKGSIHSGIGIVCGVFFALLWIIVFVLLTLNQ